MYGNYDNRKVDRETLDRLRRVPIEIIEIAYDYLFHSQLFQLSRVNRALYGIVSDHQKWKHIFQDHAQVR